MRYVGLLLKQIGRQTDNDRDQVTDTAGIPDDEILQYINDGQDRLQTVVLRDFPHCTFWDRRDEITPVDNQQAYALPGDALYGATVRKVEYSHTGLERDYFDLDYGHTDRALALDTSNYPTDYSLRGTNILLSPIPSGSAGTVRVSYVRSLDRLDIRRGLISTVNTSGSTYTSIVLADDSVLDEDGIGEHEFICVNSPLGVVTYYNAQYSGYDTSTKTLTFESGVTTTIGTIAVGSYITLGKYSTTHASELPDKAERYLIAYGVWKVLKRESSLDAVEQNQELVSMEEDILAGFSNLSLDLNRPPIYDTEWLD